MSYIEKMCLVNWRSRSFVKYINQVEYYAAMYNNHSSIRKVNLFNGQVAHVYWIDTVYVMIKLV